MDYQLELLVLPVTDVDRAKAFYADLVGFRVDVDHRAGEDFRVVQLTPPGSACSVSIGVGLGESASPIKGIHLVVADIDAARAELAGRGVQVSAVRHMTENGWADGADPDHKDYDSFADFADPDGNVWVLQERGYAGAADRPAEARRQRRSSAGRSARSSRPR